MNVLRLISQLIGIETLRLTVENLNAALGTSKASALRDKIVRRQWWA